MTNVVVEFVTTESIEVVGDCIAAVLVLLSVIVNLGGLMVMVDLIKVVVVLPLLVLVMLSLAGMIRNSSDTKPPCD